MRTSSRQDATLARATELALAYIGTLDTASGATNEDHDRRTDAIMAAINASGEAFFTGTTWRGKRCMRVSVSSWRTSDDDVDRAAAAAERALREADSHSPLRGAR